MNRFLLRATAFSAISALIFSKFAVIPPSVNNELFIPGIVAILALSLSAFLAAFVCVMEYFVGAMMTFCWRIRLDTGVGGSSP